MANVTEHLLCVWGYAWCFLSALFFNPHNLLPNDGVTIVPIL